MSQNLCVASVWRAATAESLESTSTTTRLRIEASKVVADMSRGLLKCGDGMDVGLKAKGCGGRPLKAGRPASKLISAGRETAIT